MDRPLIAISLVLAVWLVVIVIRLSGAGVSGGALAVWDESNLGDRWRRDPAKRWAWAVTEPFDAEQSPGVWVEVEPGTLGHVSLQLRWRPDDVSEWRSTQIPHHLSRDSAYFDLRENADWRGPVGQLFIGILHDADCPVRRIVVDGDGPWSAVRRGIREVFGGELYGGQSTVNILYGPQLAGTGLINWVMLTVAVLLLIEFLAAKSLGRSVRYRRVCAVFLIGWLVLDVRFALDLVTNVGADRIRYPSIADAEASVRTSSEALQRMIAGVREHVPTDAKVAVLAKDSFVVIRAKYMLYPRVLVGPLRRRNLRRPDYIIMLEAKARFLPKTRVLQLANGRRFQADLVDEAGDMRIFRVQRGLPSLPKRSQ